jgi:hypothetical protein
MEPLERLKQSYLLYSGKEAQRVNDGGFIAAT